MIYNDLYIEFRLQAQAENIDNEKLIVSYLDSYLLEIAENFVKKFIDKE